MYSGGVGSTGAAGASGSGNTGTGPSVGGSGLTYPACSLGGDVAEPSANQLCAGVPAEAVPGEEGKEALLRAGPGGCRWEPVPAVGAWLWSLSGVAMSAYHFGIGGRSGVPMSGATPSPPRSLLSSMKMQSTEPRPLGAGTVDHVALVDEPIDTAAALAGVRHPAAGAVVLFLGTVRDHSEGKDGVTHLEYEAYREHVEPKISEIVGEARGRWPLLGVSAVHRIGRVEVGEDSVAVAVSASHRAEAFAAGRYVIDELKRRVPIWKKEHWAGGAAWVREDLEHQDHES